MATPCLCGPAVWSYSAWEGLVYPRPRSRGFHPLAFLAAYFDVVEINTSFYHFLRPEITRLWLKKVAHRPAFRFTAKLNRRFSHERVLEPAEVTAFKEGLRPLLAGGRLGCLLAQFPWSFRFTSENKAFFIRLRRTFHEFPLAAEMRHSSWMSDEALGTFIDYRVAFCNVDQPPRVSAMPPSAQLTSSLAYVRLHGRSAAGAVDGSNYLYRPDELEAWRARIEQLRAYASQTFVIFNNTAGARACVNALQMQSALGADLLKRAPAGLVRRYPLELARFHPDEVLQESLFEARAVA